VSENREGLLIKKDKFFSRFLIFLQIIQSQKEEMADYSKEEIKHIEEKWRKKVGRNRGLQDYGGSRQTQILRPRHVSLSIGGWIACWPSAGIHRLGYCSAVQTH
jgi:hypothetical protein